MKHDLKQTYNNLQLTFRPHLLARNLHFQTIVSSLYHSRGTTLNQTAREMTLDAGEGVRLQGFYPVTDFYAFTDLSPQLQGHIQPYGGHVGFIDIFPLRFWISEVVLSILER